MIASLKGKPLSIKPDSLIIDVNGVGYLVYIPLSVFHIIKEQGVDEDIFLHIYTTVRDDSISLYGFLHEDDKRVFSKLINITGIGPKIAINILSTISTSDFHKAIFNEDIKTLCQVPGLGKKTAQRLVLELKEKLPDSIKDLSEPIFEDSLSALINLGYKKNIAQEALEKAYNRGLRDIESLLKESLKYLSRD
ncbi:MAG: Holliday junction branch migration protein RuvA [Thermodesulfovibrionales bacterium]|nr:Holliday junction branch migration protein RuvA [Thermodesulfovibrionales bacterium]